MKYTIVVLFMGLNLLTPFVNAQIFRKKDHKVVKKVQKSGFQAVIQHVALEEYSLRTLYVTSAKPQQSLIVFVHGAPGTISAYDMYYTDSMYMNRSDVFAFDRIGYGCSELGKAEIDIYKQAKIYNKLLDSIVNRYTTVYIVSHSFGGAISTMMTYDRKKRFTKHLMINPVISSKAEEMFWYAKLPTAFPLRYFSPKSLKSASIEKKEHKKQLVLLEPMFKEVNTPTMMIQSGKKDNLAPPPHLDEAKLLFKPDRFSWDFLPKHNHLLPFKHKEKMKPYFDWLYK